MREKDGDLGDGEGRFQGAGAHRLAVMDGRPYLQGVISGGQTSRYQEHQVGRFVAPDHVHFRLRSVRGQEENALRRVGGVELEAVADDLAHAARREHAVALAAVEVGVFQRVRFGLDRFLLDRLRVFLNRSAEAAAGADGSPHLVATGIEGISLSVEDPLDADAVVGARRVHVHALQDHVFHGAMVIFQHAEDVGPNHG